MLPVLSPNNLQAPSGSPNSGHTQPGSQGGTVVPPPVWPGVGKGTGRVPDLAAQRRRPAPRCEALLAWPSCPHDLHFAQKKSGQGAGAPGS